MNNGQQPAFHQTTDCTGNMKGLTKREYFAAIALQGVITLANGTESPAEMVKLSIVLTDELLKQLES
jgi:hypothetical protein